VKEDADYSALLRPKLARLADAAAGVPFSLGGDPLSPAGPVTQRASAQRKQMRAITQYNTVRADGLGDVAESAAGVPGWLGGTEYITPVETPYYEESGEWG
jgi:hypothetical protein